MSQNQKRKYDHKPHKIHEAANKARIEDHHVEKAGGATDAKVLDNFKRYNVSDSVCDIDQGALGSCTGNGSATGIICAMYKQNNVEKFMPARRFIYYNGRKIEGTIDEDSGCQISDVMEGIEKYGTLDEHHFIYDPTLYTQQPSAQIYAEAAKFKGFHWANVDFSQDATAAARIAHLKRVLQSGYCPVFGFTVYESFEGPEIAQTGMMSIPQAGEQIMGGHCVCMYGYDDNKKCFKVKNSWGRGWALEGSFWMPEEVAADEDICNSFVIIEQVPNPNDIPGWKAVDITPDQQNLQGVVSSGGVVNSS